MSLDQIKINFYSLVSCMLCHAGDPENVARLFRSGQLGLYTASGSYYDQERKILDEW